MSNTTTGTGNKPNPSTNPASNPPSPPPNPASPGSPAPPTKPNTPAEKPAKEPKVSPPPKPATNSRPDLGTLNNAERVVALETSTGKRFPTTANGMRSLIKNNPGKYEYVGLPNSGNPKKPLKTAPGTTKDLRGTGTPDLNKPGLQADGEAVVTEPNEEQKLIAQIQRTETIKGVKELVPDSETREAVIAARDQHIKYLNGD